MKLAAVLAAMFAALAATPGGTWAGAVPPVPTCRLQSPDVERLIQSKARALGGQEYCQYRLYSALSDVDGDGRDDFIVVFTVEGQHGGTNDHASFLAVFLSSRGPARPLLIEVGHRGERDPVSVEVDRRTIVLATREYLATDAACCPSGKGQAVYRVENGALREVKP